MITQHFFNYSITRGDCFEKSLNKLQNSGLELLNIPQQKDDLEEIISFCDEIKNSYKNLVIFGIGGSSLSGKLFADIGISDIAIHNIDTIDAHSINNLFDKLDIADSYFLVISKSGGTLETLSQLHYLLGKLDDNIISKQLAFLSSDNNNTMRQLASKLECRIMNHNTNIGGRYSCLTNVGLIVACLSDFDIYDLRSQAQAAIDDLFSQKEDSFVGQAVIHNLSALDKYHNNVFIPYSDRLMRISEWFAQLWCESIGKNGKGSNILKSMGSVDQHSQLQMWVDGRDDKSFTFITHPQRTISALENKYIDSSISYLKNSTLEDILHAEGQATIDTLIEAKKPVRHIIIGDDGIKNNIGYLLMAFMLETILCCYAECVEPFGQPAVEIGKEKARAILKNI